MLVLEDMLKNTMHQYSRLRLPKAIPVRTFVFLFDENCTDEKKYFEEFLSRELSGVNNYILVANADKKEVTELLKELKQRQREEKTEVPMPVAFQICARVHKKAVAIASLLKGAGAVQYILFADDTNPPAYHRRSTLSLPTGEAGVMDLAYLTYLRIVAEDAPAVLAGRIGLALYIPSLENYLVTVAARVHSRIRPLNQADAFSSMSLCAHDAETAHCTFLQRVPAWPGLMVFPMSAEGLKTISQRKTNKSLGKAIKLLYGENVEANTFFRNRTSQVDLKEVFKNCWEGIFRNIPIEVLTHWLPTFINKKESEMEFHLDEITHKLETAQDEPFIIKKARPWLAISALAAYENLLLQYCVCMMSIKFWKYAAVDLESGVLATDIHNQRTALNSLQCLIKNNWRAHPRTIVLQNGFSHRKESKDIIDACLSTEISVSAFPKTVPEIEELLLQASGASADEPITPSEKFVLGATGREQIANDSSIVFASVQGLQPGFIAAFAVMPFAKGVPVK